MSSYTDFQVKRSDLRRSRIVDGTPPTPHEGEALLEVDAFGFTSNNVTYALTGETLSYWDFFPAGDGWGRIPVWGFAEVTESRQPSLREGSRVFGFLPPSSHLIVRPGRVGAAAFVDASPHRINLPPAYNHYALVDSDPTYDPERADQEMVLRPVFFLSFLVDDFLDEMRLFGARVALISSASSKASLGIAFLLSRRGVSVRGLTSERNREFIEDLGVYEEVVVYGDITALDGEPTVYIDVSGDHEVREAVHRRLGGALRYSCVAGGTHWEDVTGQDRQIPGPRPTFFFVPDRIRQRTKDWGRRGLESSMREAWLPFVAWCEQWLEISRGFGPPAIEAAYRQVLDGRSPPDSAHVLQPAAVPAKPASPRTPHP